MKGPLVKNGYTLERVEERAHPAWVWRREGLPVDDPALADESVAIAEILRYPLTRDGLPTTEEMASMALEQEFDAEGRLQRATMCVVRPGEAGLSQNVPVQSCLRVERTSRIG